MDVYRVPAGAMPREPEVGRVVRYRVRLGAHADGRPGAEYDFASIRVGDGRWYTTGGTAAQGIDWATLWGAVAPVLVGPLVVLCDEAGCTVAGRDE